MKPALSLIGALAISASALPLALTLTACGSAFVDAGSGGAGDTARTQGGGLGGSGSGTSSSSSSNGSSGNASPPCASDAECGPTDECAVRVCSGGACADTILFRSVDAPSQIYGDCKVSRCDAGGRLVVSEDATDVYDDGNPCTAKKCQSGMMQVTVKHGACGPPGLVCNPTGECVACLKDADCLLPGELICRAGACVPTACGNGVKDPDETYVDCGGVCVPCPDHAPCAVATDCQSGICKGAIGARKCNAPACDDNVRNGNETDVDCGESCPPCGPDAACRQPADCASGVCWLAKCKAPTCTDGVKNGMETSPDCGGGCTTTCPSAP